MRPSRTRTLALTCILAVLICGCPDRRPTWSIDTAAIDTLDLEAGFDLVDSLPPEWPAPGCQLVITATADEAPPSTSSTAKAWRSWLADAGTTEAACVGRCVDGSNCLMHYSVAYRNAESAETRCSCKPREEVLCALVIEWRVGKEARRSIRRVWCEGGAASNSCGLLFAPSENRLEMSCSTGS
jgi:hypothetical protein